jgi:type II secretion system protein G
MGIQVPSCSDDIGRVVPVFLRKEHHVMNIVSKLQKRLASEKGFTLIELLVVLVIIGILLAIAVPSYLGFKDRANETSAKANIRAAVPAAEAFYADNGTYVGMTLAALQAIDAGVKLSVAPADLSATAYCLKTVVGNKTAWKAGPAGDVVVVRPTGCTA